MLRLHLCAHFTGLILVTPCAGSFHCVKRRGKMFFIRQLRVTGGGIGGTDSVDGRRKRVTATMRNAC